MALDPNIILGIRQPQIQQVNPLDSYAKVLGLKNAMAQGEMQNLQMQQAQQGMESDRRIRALLGNDPNAKPEQLMAIDPKIGMQIAKNRSDIASADATRQRAISAANKDDVESKLKRLSHGAALLSTAKDQASWDAALTVGRLQGIFDEKALSLFPREFDPATVNAIMNAGITEAQRLEQAHRDAVLAETQRSHRANEAQTAANAPFVAGPDGRPVANAPVQQFQIDKATSGRPQAPRLQYDAERGVVIDLNSGQTRPITDASTGAPAPAKLSEAQRKELLSINQQRSVIDGALRMVESTPDAFSFARGTATRLGGTAETIAGRFDTPSQTEARSMVFNIVSKVINERAGAAQSAQELARLRGFLPAEQDNAEQIKNKLTGFKKYLSELETGSRTPTGGAQAPQTASPRPQIGARVGGFIYRGGDPNSQSSWEATR